MALWFVFMLLAEGLVAGAVAQSVLPEVSVLDTIVLGLVGSYLGGVIAWLFVNAGVGLVFALIGAAALLYTRRRFVEQR